MPGNQCLSRSSSKIDNCITDHRSEDINLASGNRYPEVVNQRLFFYYPWECICSNMHKPLVTIIFSDFVVIH